MPSFRPRLDRPIEFGTACSKKYKRKLLRGNEGTGEWGNGEGEGVWVISKCVHQRITGDRTPTYRASSVSVPPVPAFAGSTILPTHIPSRFQHWDHLAWLFLSVPSLRHQRAHILCSHPPPAPPPHLPTPPSAGVLQTTVHDRANIMIFFSRHISLRALFWKSVVLINLVDRILLRPWNPPPRFI